MFNKILILVKKMNFYDLYIRYFILIIDKLFRDINSYQLNEQEQIVDICLSTVQDFTPPTVEIWQ